jgi:hypothetical protein
VHVALPAAWGRYLQLLLGLGALCSAQHHPAGRRAGGSEGRSGPGLGKSLHPSGPLDNRRWSTDSS